MCFSEVKRPGYHRRIVAGSPTVDGAKGEPFRVIARTLGREDAETLPLSGKVAVAGADGAVYPDRVDGGIHGERGRGATGFCD